jgi:hypothetical protein
MRLRRMSMSKLAERLAISPHPKAPMFSGKRTDHALTVQQVINDLTSEHPLGNQEAIDLVRQLTLVNLWFALKYVAGFRGPYNEMNEDLHLDMCNFRQSPDVMLPGSKAFAAIPRGYFKSTIFSHGGDWWELLRNPDLRIGIVNAIQDRAVDFMRIVQRNFDSNELVAELFPEYIPEAGQDRWNAKQMVLPNRSRHFKEPNIKPIGATGAVEGDHFDLANIDDLVGMEDLNSEFMINASMLQRVKWFKVAKTALLIDENSRVMMVATRYAMDDPYQIAMDNAKVFHGYKNPDFKVNESNPEWSIYYRMCIENGKAILPNVMSKERYMRMINDDPWTAITQYMNDPQKTGLAEFYKFETGRCELHWNPRDEEWYIKQITDSNWDDEGKVVRLGSCDVVMSLDPAFTDKGVSAKTSRTSLGIWAMDRNENRYRIWSRVGYFDVRDTYQHIVDGFKQFQGYIRKLVLETNGAQKALPGAIWDFGAAQGVFIPVDGQPMTGDKDARIRSALSLPLARGKVWVTEEAGLEFIEEQKSFPMSEYRKDVLDETEKAFSNLMIPSSEEENAEMDFERDAEEWDRLESSFGY